MHPRHHWTELTPRVCPGRAASGATSGAASAAVKDPAPAWRSQTAGNSLRWGFEEDGEEDGEEDAEEDAIGSSALRPAPTGVSFLSPRGFRGGSAVVGGGGGSGIRAVSGAMARLVR